LFFNILSFFCISAFTNDLLVNKFPKSFDLSSILNLSLNSITLIAITCSALIFLSFVVNYGIRITDNRYLKALTNFSVSGYAIPGVILSVTVLTFASYADHF